MSIQKLLLKLLLQLQLWAARDGTVLPTVEKNPTAVAKVRDKVEATFGDKIK